jgi:hypothetical protein
VADVLVLDHDVGFDGVAGGEAIGNLAQRRDQLVAAGFLEREDVHVEIIARAQKLDGLFQLLVEAVVEGNRGVAGQPAMRNKRAVLRAVVGQEMALRFMWQPWQVVKSAV